MKLSRGIKLEWSICFDMVMVVCHMHAFQRKSFVPIRDLPTFGYISEISKKLFAQCKKVLTYDNSFGFVWLVHFVLCLFLSFALTLWKYSVNFENILWKIIL